MSRKWSSVLGPRFARRSLGEGGALVAIGCGRPKSADDSGFHTLTIESPDDLKEFFSYSPDRIPFVSAHRGGDRKYFPEDCIETFPDLSTLVRQFQRFEVS